VRHTEFPYTPTSLISVGRVPVMANDNGNGAADTGNDNKGSDKVLLERLNALKPTNITIDGPAATTIISASTIDRAKPPSRENVLSDRLKSLRGQIGDEPTVKEPVNSTSHTSQVDKDVIPETKNTKSPSVASGKTMPSIAPSTEPTQTLGPFGASAVSSTEAATMDAADEDADDPLLSMTDDQTLEDLLADLESDQQWVEEMAIAEEEEQHKKAMALLEELSPGKDNLREGSRGTNSQHDEGDNDLDDSDGEVVTREADDLIAKALDEVELDRRNTRSSSPPAQDHNPQSTDQDEGFTASIASRMAALNVSHSVPPRDSRSIPATLPSVPATEPDPFAAMLPSAPTQDPATKPAVVTGVLRKTARRGGAYTDDDQKSWCTVCLDDGTMRCLGCDDDGAGGNIYCERCWREMHVGPMAGFDDLGHKWEKFERER